MHRFAAVRPCRPPESALSLSGAAAQWVHMDGPGITSADVAVGELDTPVGRISVTVTEAGLAKLSWVGRQDGPNPSTTPDHQRLAPVLTQLTDYFDGLRHDFDLPLDWRHTHGSQQDVLKSLHATVTYGRSVTYGELATRSRTGVPARGIGAIMGSNPIPIVVPCHRVLAHDGLGGYSGGSGRNGLEVKRWLLTLEGVLPPTFDWNPRQLES